MNNDRGRNWNHNNWDRRSWHPRGGFNRGVDKRPWRGVHKNFRGSQSYGNFGGYHAGNRHHNDYNQSWKNRPQRDTPGKRLSEEETGVTQYMTDHKGFNGIIKSRYSDFQVSEINEKGEVAVLTNLSPPKIPIDEMVVEDEDLLLTKYNLEILPMDTWDKINKLALSPEESTEVVEIDVTGMTKEQRTKIHDAVKKAFCDSIVGSTVNDEDKKIVRFERYREGVRIDNRVKWIWPAEYVHFIVHKENCDTMDAAVRIAERLKLNIKPAMLGYAGTKDRRAKTSQWFSARKVDPRRVADACRGLRDVRVGNYSFRAAALTLGMLTGNKFRIALRNVTASDEVVNEACEQLKVRGFINYYGLQRFGTRIETPTYEIGIKLLQGNFREAIDSILEVREGPSPLCEALRRYRACGGGGRGAAAALRSLGPRAPRAAPETRLLRALARNPNDLLGALAKLARNTRLLYLHSYQSLVWNRAVSERLRRGGVTPMAGDLVPLTNFGHQETVEDEESDNDDTLDSEDAEQENDDKQEDEEETTENQNESANSETNKTDKQKGSKDQEKVKIPVKVLTQEDIDSGTYTIFDIVLPLPGYNIDYPPNMKEYYEELLKKDGLTLELRNRIKSYSMSGTYRHVGVRPLGVAWRCVRYSDPFADLLLSDLDRLEGRELTGILDDGKFKALLLTMSLPASCYATMALRELLKVDTSSDNQAAQNNYHKKKDKKKSKKGNTSTASEMSEETSESERNETMEGETTDDVETENGIKEEKQENGAEKRKLEDDEEEVVEVKKLKEEGENDENE